MAGAGGVAQGWSTFLPRSGLGSQHRSCVRACCYGDEERQKCLIALLLLLGKVGAMSEPWYQRQGGAALEPLTPVFQGTESGPVLNYFLVGGSLCKGLGIRRCGGRGWGVGRDLGMDTG